MINLLSSVGSSNIQTCQIYIWSSEESDESDNAVSKTHSGWDKDIRTWLKWQHAFQQHE